MESIMVLSIRNAFHSRGQHIRMEIGKDLNNNPDLGINQVFDLLQKYYNMISASGEGGSKLPPNDVSYIDSEGEGGGNRVASAV